MQDRPDMQSQDPSHHKIGPAAGSGESPATARELSGTDAQQWPVNLRIARDGTWFHDGGPIRRKALIKLFSTVLRREDDGTYWLITPAERQPIVVEDAPFVAEELTATGEGVTAVLRLRTNVDDWIELGPDHPLRIDHDPATGEPRPYILVRCGLEARLARSVYYHLVELADAYEFEGQERLGVWSKGQFFALDNPTEQHRR